MLLHITFTDLDLAVDYSMSSCWLYRVILHQPSSIHFQTNAKDPFNRTLITRTNVVGSISNINRSDMLNSSGPQVKRSETQTQSEHATAITDRVTQPIGKLTHHRKCRKNQVRSKPGASEIPCGESSAVNRTVWAKAMSDEGGRRRVSLPLREREMERNWARGERRELCGWWQPRIREQRTVS